MKTKSKIDLTKFSIITIIGLAIVIFIVNMFYNKNNYKETWIICSGNNNTQYYQEEMKFRYVGETFTGFYRTENILLEGESNIAESKKVYQEKLDLLTLDDNFSYKIEDSDIGFTVSTFIDIAEHPTLFNNFAKSLGIEDKSSKDTIKDTLNSLDYECKEKKK